jgi:alkylhydroperoxidase/carboxymuconolactone decarboxylase family protein YurZ
MQLPREMYKKGGLSSLKEARDILEKYSLPGEKLAYINDEEAKYLRYMGGAGIPINSSGIPSYFSLKKLFKPVAKILDKVVPDFIKPALPFLAAAFPMFAPGFLASMGNFLLPSALTAAGGAAAAGGALSFLPGAIGGGLVNLGAQLSQKGAAERGINPMSLALSSIGGGLSTPGVGEALRGGQVLGVDELGQAITRGSPGVMETLQANYPGLDFSTSNLTGQGAQYGIGVGPPPETSFLTGAQNFATETAAKGADVFKAGQEADSIFSKEFVTAALPGQIGAAGDLAYNAALDAQKKYEQEMLAMGNLASANKQDQINYIRRAMVSAGFNEDEIGSAITRSGFKYGGYAEYANGGIMDLGGNEIDYRASGGFVPIGKKERADDVPARLSKNEFVFTAKAVRNAGGGDVRKGAKRMYQIMNQLEARA